ncbi:thiosulfohydrolase SoxB, partial [Paeniroseomonas aquatica]|nr:thiosulfohydrolase SoxB [Paeniroseomonas aquatica]
MIHRRHFLQAAAAAASLGIPVGRAAAAQALTQDQLLAFDPVGQVTLLHLTDLHAQLVPMYFREPSLNVGVGSAKGQPPHLTEAAFRQAFDIAAGSPDAYTLTAEDFTALAREYGRMGGLDRIATLVGAIRAQRGDGRVLFLDGGDTWHGSWTALQTKGADMVGLMDLLKIDGTTGHFEFTLGAERMKELADARPYKFMAGNVLDEWKEPVFTSWQVIERGGVQIGVVGQAFPFTPVANPRWMIPD